MRTVAFLTLGCKVNQYDSQAMLEQFMAAGYTPVDFEDEADVYVINTCTVTGTGDKKSMQSIRRAARKNPAAAIVVCGCLAQRAAEELKLPGVKLILGTQHRSRVVRLLEAALAGQEALVAVEGLAGTGFETLRVTAHEGKMRAVMKIQEGCNRFCTYCVIPSVRGPIRSRPLDDIEAEAASLAQAGYREVVLTGIHLASYGLDFEEKKGLMDAVAAVGRQPDILRVRLGSLEPGIVTPAFVDALSKQAKVCPQFHLSLQSGSDSVLRRMGRRYTVGEYLDACALLRRTFPDAAITTDVMCGFPGETEDDFAQTRRTVAEADFARMHVFPYSERAGTPAASMDGAVPKAVREERARVLIAQGEEMARAYHQGLVGRCRAVLFETAEGPNRAAGYTPEYIRVRAEGGVPGALREVRITHFSGDALLGVVI